MTDRENPVVWGDQTYEDVFGYQYPFEPQSEEDLMMHFVSTLSILKSWMKDVGSWSSFASINLILAIGLIVVAVVLSIKGVLGWAVMSCLIFGGISSALLSGAHYLTSRALALVRTEHQLRRADELMLVAEIIQSQIEEMVFKEFGAVAADQLTEEITVKINQVTPTIADKITALLDSAKRKKKAMLDTAASIVKNN